MTDRKLFQLRLPPDVKVWLADQAARNGSSQNSEVIRAVRERMDQDLTTHPRPSAVPLPVSKEF